jgi:cytochrome b pre-mRNA-processing protein 3
VKNLFRRRWPDPAQALYDQAVLQARQPKLYAEMGSPDTVEGRFELMTAHIILLIEALDAQGERARSQSVFDIYISNLDGALREMGVGDLSVGKRIRGLGEAFYGRAAALREAFSRLPDRTLLTALAQRTVFADAPQRDPAALVDYFVRCRLELRNAPVLASPPWPMP